MKLFGVTLLTAAVAHQECPERPYPPGEHGASLINDELIVTGEYFVYAKYPGSIGEDDATCQKMNFQPRWGKTLSLSISEVESVRRFNIAPKRKKIVESGVFSYEDDNFEFEWNQSKFNRGVKTLEPVDKNGDLVLLYHCDESDHSSESVIILSTTNGFGASGREERLDDLVVNWNLEKSKLIYPINSIAYCEIDEDEFNKDHCDPCKQIKGCQTIIDCHERSPGGTFKSYHEFQNFGDEWLFEFDLYINADYSDLDLLSSETFFAIGTKPENNENIFGQVLLKLSKQTPGRRRRDGDGDRTFKLTFPNMEVLESEIPMPNGNTKISVGQRFFTDPNYTGLCLILVINGQSTEYFLDFLPRHYLEDVKIYLGNTDNEGILISNLVYHDLTENDFGDHVDLAQVGNGPI